MTTQQCSADEAQAVGVDQCARFTETQAPQEYSMKAILYRKDSQKTDMTSTVRPPLCCWCHLVAAESPRKSPRSPKIEKMSFGLSPFLPLFPLFRVHSSISNSPSCSPLHECAPHVRFVWFACVCPATGVQAVVTVADMEEDTGMVGSKVAEGTPVAFTVATRLEWEVVVLMRAPRSPKRRTRPLPPPLKECDSVCCVPCSTACDLL